MQLQSFTFVETDGRREVAHRHENPDGSPGGWVASTAEIHPTAIVEVDAIVEPGARVGPGEIVKNGSVKIGQ